MDQGYFINFYARADYVKQIKTTTGLPFAVGMLSAYVFKHGYTNIKFKCFGDTALQIQNKQWLKGKGILGFNMAQNQEEYKQLEIVIEEFELAEQPPFKDYTKTAKSTPKNQYQKPKKDTTELEEELFAGITEDDLPF